MAEGEYDGDGLPVGVETGTVEGKGEGTKVAGFFDGAKLGELVGPAVGTDDSGAKDGGTTGLPVVGNCDGEYEGQKTGDEDG